MECMLLSHDIYAFLGHRAVYFCQPELSDSMLIYLDTKLSFSSFGKISKTFKLSHLLCLQWAVQSLS